ncbi:MAG: TrkA family potassium uptake protein [Chloroflexi bacterium]|nr:MAG: TrkA family potassium uptake protein [Chloroflexota bacterium]
MYIIVVGAGTVGYGLGLELQALADHEVVLVDRDRSRAGALREELGEMVVHGDGTEVVFLESVGARRADMLIAVTGDDGANLVSCQVAKHWFKVGRTIARVNNPRNERLFRELGIDSTVSATGAIMAQIEFDLPEHTFIPLMKLHGSGLQLVDLHVIAGSEAEGAAVRSLRLPENSIISLVVHEGGAPEVPNGDTVLRAGDEIIAVIPQEAEPEFRRLVAGATVTG